MKTIVMSDKELDEVRRGMRLYQTQVLDYIRNNVVKEVETSIILRTRIERIVIQLDKVANQNQWWNIWRHFGYKFYIMMCTGLIFCSYIFFKLHFVGVIQ
jgi:hypothetical protein